MDYKEMYNAGDDAKLMLIGCPAKTRRFLYALEDEALVNHLGKRRRYLVVNRYPTYSIYPFGPIYGAMSCPVSVFHAVH